MEYLNSLTDTQLYRLYRKAFARMSQYDGYQMFGYDWITLRITKPEWYELLKKLNNTIAQRQIDYRSGLYGK